MSVCLASALSASASQGSGAGGHEAVVLVFTDTSSTSCTLQGYPTSAWFIANGTRLPATVTQQVEAPGAIVMVTLSPSQKAATTVWTDNTGVPPASYCDPVTTNQVAVQLPGTEGTVTAPVVLSVCSTNNNIGTTPITSGTTESPM
ncbi:MAG TPA: DUF4232 domain-containing protein [Acidimicrobiales bacterium]|nr:DUF4232 domain-containing protein [Acidimicrobiales bacterium]